MLGFWRVLGPLQALLMTFNMEFSTKKCAGGGREIAFGRMLERELHLVSLLGMLLDVEERGREREREQLFGEGFCNAAMSSSSSSMQEVQLSCVTRSNAFLDHESSSSSNSSTTTWGRRGRSTRTSF